MAYIFFKFYTECLQIRLKKNESPHDFCMSSLKIGGDVAFNVQGYAFLGTHFALSFP